MEEEEGRAAHDVARVSGHGPKRALPDLDTEPVSSRLAASRPLGAEQKLLHLRHEKGRI